MSGDSEAAQITPVLTASAAVSSENHTPAQIVQRWREIRRALIQQLEAFETGALTLHANSTNISAAAIADLKRSIFEFDALISGPAQH